ncbi:MAG: hypothetical protein KF716_31045 [Anaerolineae bacterium]|nr:hypothetical protein [Anaerolineae bacterium]
MNLFDPQRTPPSKQQGAAGVPGNGEVFQMLWDCRFCGTTKLLGLDHRHCPNCGAPQNPEWRYFPSEADIKFVSDPHYEYTGADKVCPFCQQPNSAASKFCKQCGGDLTGAKDAAVKDREVTGLDGAKGLRDDVVKKQFERDLGLTDQQKQDQSKSMTRLFIAIGVIVLAFVGIFGYLFFSKTSNSLAVTEQTWVTGIQLEQLNTSTGSDWRDSVPGGAYNVSCQQRDRSYTDYVQEQCGYEYVDRGDGSGQRVPKMCQKAVQKTRSDSYCSYTIDRWLPLPDITNTGGLNDPIATPEYSASLVTTGIGRVRLVNTYLQFTIRFQNPADGAQYEYNPDNEDSWRGFKVGQHYTVDINRLGIPSWETLKRVQE